MLDSRTAMGVRVCVIGAGAAGLCALRHLTAAPHKFSCVAYEQTEDVGGTWVYHPDAGPHVHTSMYRDMKTNLPKELMAFLDFPFPRGSSFMHHSVVWKYLKDYTSHFGLSSHIKFGHKVESVAPETAGDRIYWNVIVRDKSGQTQSSQYDSVIICNGHYFEPRYPTIPGLEKFKGSVSHSHDYRSPESYADQRVLLLGAHSSGQDIAVEISKTASEVILSHNKPLLKGRLPENMVQMSGIARATENGFVFQDGTHCEVDAILFCTGYYFSFPFLKPECGVTVTNNYVSPLYKHCVHVRFPSLIFIGLPSIVVPFPLFDVQVQFALKVLANEVTLPSEADMIQDAELDLEQRRIALNLGPFQGHVLSGMQWSYAADLASKYGVKEYPVHMQPMYNEMWNRRVNDLVGYKDSDIHLDIGSGEPI